MSNEENAKETVDAAKNIANNLLSSMLNLKEKNPKVFFGVIGGVVALVVLMMMSGGGSKTVTGPVIKNLSVGQRYVLKSANAYDKDATVRLVSVPGTIAAYDDTEEADRSGACQHMAQGTAVSVLELQDAYGKKNAYAKVQIEEGECKGNSGWALSIDVQ
ncbi:MAG: hypothetical protein EPN89_03645 [Methylovulum sp.]|nr:MAG: hypothetical protein EPN89_03645 [Methylovulum sp.]